MNRAIAGADGHQISAAIDFAPDFILTELAFGRNRELEIDVAVTGVQIDIGG
jgi:hypothetical protein